MCGIVFVGGTTLSSANIERFENLLFADTFRGEHSTGVMAYYKPYNADAFMKIAKKAIPGDMFLRSKIWDDVKEHKASTTNPVTKAVTTSSINPKFMVGHNRYATAGAVNDKNAHPFQHEHITLVHNGSLNDQSLLPDHKMFEVDSENVCYSIAKIGIAETIKKLNGAFVLVWHDAKENTLNFIRNDERPFYMMKTNTGDWYGASEKDMVKWVMSRRKFNPTIEKEFELEVGVQYIFDTADGLKFREEVKHELPTFRTTTYYNSRYWTNGSYQTYDDDEYDDYDWRGGNRANSYPTRVSSNSQQSSEMRATVEKHHQLNEMLQAHGLDVRIGERMKFEAFQFEPYPKNPERGQLTGWVGDGEYIEVQGHGVEKTIYGGEQLYSGKVISAYEANYILTLIVSDVKDETIKVTPIPLDDEYDEDDEMEHIISSTVRGTSLIAERHTPEDLDTPHDPELEEEGDGESEHEMDVTRDGSVYSKKEWEGNDCLNCCGNCGSPIPFDFCADATVFRDYAYCDTCVDNGLVDGCDPKVLHTKEEPQLGELRFECIECSTELPVDAESEKECVCLQCYANKYAKKDNVRPILTYRKTLQNGMKVTLTQWNEMNTCSWCHEKIPFNKASVTEFLGSTPCCATCAKKLELGMVPGHNS